MLTEEYLQKIIQISLGSSPENMLKTSLEICTELLNGEGGAILGEEGPALQFLFSSTEELIGVNVPFDSIAGITINENMIVYTHAPSDKRHFDGVDKQLAKQTNYLLSIPIPSIRPSSADNKTAKNAGALQILFNKNIYPELDVKNGAQEFYLADFKSSKLYTEKLQDVFFLLPIIAFSMEVITLRQTSHQVIHELKNKMIASLSWMEYLKEDINGINPEILDNDDIKEDMNLAVSAVREGSKLAKNYLQLTKIYNPEFSSCNVNDILKETASSAKALAANLGIEGLTIDLKLSENIKNCTLDSEKLKMAFFNICKNALEALFEFKTKNPKLSFSSEIKQDKLFISIADNGPGMPPEIADNLFIPFKTKKEGGTGLGLTITKKIIDLHVGRIACKTSKNGTIFEILI